MAEFDLDRRLDSLLKLIQELREGVWDPPVSPNELDEPEQALAASLLAELGERVGAAADLAAEGVAALARPADQAELQRNAFMAFAGVQGAEAEVDALVAAINPGVTSVSQVARKVWNWVIGYLKPLLKRISAQLWQALAKLLAPKEWSVKGGVSTGPFGLASAEIEITFGP